MTELRRPVGRPSKYNEDVQAKAELYLDTFKDLGDEVPTVIGLALFLDVATNTVYNWYRDEVSPEFLRVFMRVEQIQHQRLVNQGLIGNFNPAITKMMLTKHGYSDKQELAHTSPDGSMSMPSRIEIVAPQIDDSQD